MALPYAGGSSTLNIDSRNVQVGLVLLQTQPDNITKTAGYWSWSLIKPEQVYDTIHRECFVIVWPVLILQPHLERNRFTIRRNHGCLMWIHNVTNATGGLARWRVLLSEFELDVVHSVGIEHQAADALSRMTTDGADITLIEDD